MTLAMVELYPGTPEAVLVGPFTVQAAVLWLQACPKPAASAAVVRIATGPLAALEAVQAGKTPAVPPCCVGPDDQGRHMLNCTGRCQVCSGDPAGPNRCRCRDVRVTCADCGGALTVEVGAALPRHWWTDDENDDGLCMAAGTHRYKRTADDDRGRGYNFGEPC